MNRAVFIVMIAATFLLSSCETKTESKSKFFELKDLPEPEPDPPLSSPLQVNDIRVGTGEEAQNGDTVLLHYTGWLYEDGTRGKQFDTSRVPDRELFEVKIGETGVIKGWTRGLVGMKVGGLRQLIIPPELAFGKAGKAPNVPPSATLEFEIEVFGIVKGIPTDAPTAGEAPHQ